MEKASYQHKRGVASYIGTTRGHRAGPYQSWKTYNAPTFYCCNTSSITFGYWKASR